MQLMNELLDNAKISFSSVCNDVSLENLDYQLANAALEVFKSGNMTPLIKEELKTKIQASRLKRGKDELTVEFKSEQKYELSDEEKARISKRKEANRLAAVRFRQRRKSKEQQLSEECDSLEARNAALLRELEDLQRQKGGLLEAISQIRSPP
ncbi:hypothetical protein SNE40_008976 [Patella caerulea]|uniref:BZIP domain-containing protein n=1 Tax=Patella caerulea TaxID=87958 RepID=A0AAN8PPH0_PATCE